MLAHKINAPSSATTARNKTKASARALSLVTPSTYVPVPLGEVQTDEELVALTQQGNQRAFEILVRKYQRKITQLVARLVGDGDAPDVAQETFIKVYRAINNFRGQSAFYTWLYRIGINTAKNHLVARNRRISTQDIDVADAEQFGHTDFLSNVDTPQALLLSEEIRQQIDTVIKKLPPDLREAIVLREFEGLSYEEISIAMNCPIGTVRSRIFRAREAIDLVVQPLMAA